MPSLIFTRQQVLNALSDTAARQEAEAVPDFIYYFLRDVFFAVDVDGDGYVMLRAVLSALPLLASPGGVTASSSSSAPAAAAAAAASTQGGSALSLLAAGVPSTWCGPCVHSTVTPLTEDCRPPLDLCAVMHLFWPVVSDRLARLLGDTWSQRSSSSDDVDRHRDEKDDAAHHGGGEAAVGGAKGPQPIQRGRSRRTLFSPSPFRGLSPSPPRSAAAFLCPRTVGGAVVGCSSSGQTVASSGSPLRLHMPLCDGVAWDQQRLYRETLLHLWTPSSPVSSPVASAAATDSLLHPLASPPPPRRLLSDDEVRQLRLAFDYLDCDGCGLVTAAEVAAALQAFIDAAKRASSRCAGGGQSDAAPAAEAEAASGDVAELARAMVSLAVSAAAPAASSSGHSPDTPGEPCLTWPVFVRSFQCDSGAFPAELIAWCVCSTNTSSRGGEGGGAGCDDNSARTRPSPSSPRHPSRLADSKWWMSPLECAVVQHLLTEYATQLDTPPCGRGDCALSAEVAIDTGDSSTSPASAAQTIDAGKKKKKPRLSQRSTVNLSSSAPEDAKKAAAPAQLSGLQPCDGSASALSKGRRTFLEWRRSRRGASASRNREDGGSNGTDDADAPAVLPLSVLRVALTQDVREALFSSSDEFSAVAGATAEAVVDSHVRAVGNVARYTMTDDAMVDVAHLADLLAADPRLLGLDVLVPLSARLEAVVDAAQRLPRRVVELAVRATADCVADQSHASPDCLHLAPLLRLRRRLASVSPPLARLVTGATRLVDGALALHDCVALLSAQVLSVPPPLAAPAQQRRCLADSTSAGICLRMCSELSRDALVVKASRGWLRYACRAMPHVERQAILAALQRHRSGSGGGDRDVFEVARALIGSRSDPALLAQQPAAHDVFARLFALVSSSCWTCQVDKAVAAHVALALAATAYVAPATMAADPALWWRAVDANLAAWVRAQWGGGGRKEGGTESSWGADDRWLGDEWAIAAIHSTAAEVSAAACRAISVELCRLRSADGGDGGATVLVDDATLLTTLTHEVQRGSVWSPLLSALPHAHEACQRLACTLVSCCRPLRRVDRLGDNSATADGERCLLDMTPLLRRWLERFPLPLSTRHVSYACDVAEVASIYYTLKRLAASEASRRRRSNTPQPHLPSVREGGVPLPLVVSPSTKSKQQQQQTKKQRRCAADAVVVTGITPVCLGELLENDAVLAALYAVSPPHAVGVWSGSLYRLETVLRPLVLSSTGVRVSLRRVGEDTEPDGKGTSPQTLASDVVSGDCELVGVSCGFSDSSSAFARDVLVAMALPPAVQHAVAQLFCRVDAGGAGRVTEDQLRSHRPQVPAAARYGWHRFVTVLCSPSIACSAVMASPGFSLAVVRAHGWGRGGETTDVHAAPEEQSESSVATQRTDDDTTATGAAAMYSLADLLVRVGELRACVQGHLLEEQQASSSQRYSPLCAPSGGGGGERVGRGGLTRASRPSSLTDLAAASGPAAAMVTAAASPVAGTAQWWAVFLEVFCHSYSPLA